MAIKIDLEKAYDWVRWDFIDASLWAAGIPTFFHNVIVSAISTSTMQVLWNGVPMPKFRLAKGIRQGCPFSSQLFGLCMEWPGHSINLALSCGDWRPIRLSRLGPNLSYIFFTNDLVIFCKADGRLLKEILHNFYEISRHKVNPRKTNMFFSKGVEDSMTLTLSGLLGFQKMQDLRHYLAVPLFHQIVTNNTMHFMVEKVRTKLQSWDAQQLSIAGRATLAQSVLLLIPSYFMHSMMIPRGVCKEIESLEQSFIWGSFEGKRKISLIGWDTICQPKDCGGLGKRQLRDQNISFLLKLNYKVISNEEALWARVVKSKYGLDGFLPNSIARAKSSFLWQSL